MFKLSSSRCSLERPLGALEAAGGGRRSMNPEYDAASSCSSFANLLPISCRSLAVSFRFICLSDARNGARQWPTALLLVQSNSPL